MILVYSRGSGTTISQVPLSAISQHIAAQNFQKAQRPTDEIQILWPGTQGLHNMVRFWFYVSYFNQTGLTIIP